MKIKNFLVALIIGALVFSATAFPAVSAVTVTSFSDVGEWDTTFKAIDYLREEEVVVGYSDGTYGLDSNINRAEFLKIVMEVTDYELAGEDCYPDVSDEWFAPYICAADELGFVDGYPDGDFKPGNDINFAEASKMITNILGMELVDDGDMWFSPYVFALEDTDSIPADIRDFDQNVSRGEMAEMIWRIDTETTYKISNTYENIQAGVIVEEYGSGLQTFESCTELADYFEDNSYDYYYDYRGWEDDIMMVEETVGVEMEKSVAAPEAADSINGGGGSEDYSTTNIQVEGVDEADIVKTDGEYIYLIKGDDVRIVKAFPPLALEEVADVNFGDSSFYPYEMYVDGDRLVVIGSTYANVFDYYYGTAVYILDISDKSNVEVVRDVVFEGDYNTSRKIGDTVYLVANQWNYYMPWDGVWVEDDLVPLYLDSAVGEVEEVVDCGGVRYMPGVIDVTDYTILAAIPVDDVDGEIGEEVIIGSYGTVYASMENLYIAEPRYKWDWWYEDSGDSEETYIHRFGLSATDIDYEGVGSVPGTVLNQFSMDESGEYFRIATTTGGWWGDSWNNVYVLDGDLDVVGELEGLAPGEEIYSTRFMGNRLYMVTFEQIDPLFVIDLSDPTDPTVLGELHIPGVSDYLHPFDEDHIIGFGLDTLSADAIASLGWSWFQGMKVSMFDVSDVENPVELHKVVIGDRGTTSELLYNHKALLFDKAKGIMAFPVLLAEIPQAVKDDLDIDSWIYGDYTFQGAYVYDVSVENGFELVGTISHYDADELGSDFEYYYYYGDNKDVERILYIGDYYYTISNLLVQANDMDDLDEVNEVELAD